MFEPRWASVRPSVQNDSPVFSLCGRMLAGVKGRREAGRPGQKTPFKETTSLSLCVSADSLECLSCQSACQRASAVSGRSGERWNVSQRVCSH